MKIRMIYLLGGNSRRFPSNKLIYDFLGKPLYQHVFDRLYELVNLHTEYELYVVTQHEKIVEQLEWVQHEKIKIIYDKDCALGASYSIKAAVTQFPKEEAYDIFVVGDQPFLSKETIEGLITKTVNSHSETGCVLCEGNYGNPTIFHSSLEGELLQLDGDKGGRKVFIQHLDHACLYEIFNSKELRDIDSLSDIQIG